MPVRLGAALVAEFVGTFALCCIGILAIHWSDGNLVLVALAHGLILSTLVCACMPTSGGHLNPAITVGFLITGKIKPVAGVAYIVIQLLAGIAASLFVYAIFQDGNVVKAGTPTVNVIFSPAAALLCEIVAAFLLAFAVWGSAADPRAKNVGGFAIGLTVAADILAFGPITGASMNPARSFGPTLISAMTTGSSAWHLHWVYWCGPIIGAGIAALLYHLVLWPRDSRQGIDPGASDVPATQRP